jgi:hypothetical protein
VKASVSPASRPAPIATVALSKVALLESETVKPESTVTGAPPSAARSLYNHSKAIAIASVLAMA